VRNDARLKVQRDPHSKKCSARSISKDHNTNMESNASVASAVSSSLSVAAMNGNILHGDFDTNGTMMMEETNEMNEKTNGDGGGVMTIRRCRSNDGDAATAAKEVDSDDQPDNMIDPTPQHGLSEPGNDAPQESTTSRSSHIASSSSSPAALDDVASNETNKTCIVDAIVNGDVLMKNAPVDHQNGFAEQHNTGFRNDDHADHDDGGGGGAEEQPNHVHHAAYGSHYRDDSSTTKARATMINTDTGNEEVVTIDILMNSATSNTEMNGHHNGAAIDETCVDEETATTASASLPMGVDEKMGGKTAPSDDVTPWSLDANIAVQNEPGEVPNDDAPVQVDHDPANSSLDNHDALAEHSNTIEMRSLREVDVEEEENDFDDFATVNHGVNDLTALPGEETAVADSWVDRHDDSPSVNAGYICSNGGKDDSEGIDETADGENLAAEADGAGVVNSTVEPNDDESFKDVIDTDAVEIQTESQAHKDSPQEDEHVGGLEAVADSDHNEDDEFGEFGAANDAGNDVADDDEFGEFDDGGVGDNLAGEASGRVIDIDHDDFGNYGGTSDATEAKQEPTMVLNTSDPLLAKVHSVLSKLFPRPCDISDSATEVGDEYHETTSVEALLVSTLPLMETTDSLFLTYRRSTART
jgi:hypothetical protein